MIRRTLGGDRVGSGKKMQIEMSGYERSNQNLKEVFRSTVAPGTLVPFYKIVGLPGDTFDINLYLDITTLPTVGPLLGEFKAQLDLYVCPWRLYNSFLHNNTLGAGLDMAAYSKLPIMNLTAKPIDLDTTTDINSSQVNPSSILSYLGLKGVGYAATEQERSFNAIPLIAYWDIYKNYYSNKQEEIGAVIHASDTNATAQTVTTVTFSFNGGVDSWQVEQAPAMGDLRPIFEGGEIRVEFTGTEPDAAQIMIHMQARGLVSVLELCGGVVSGDGTTYFSGAYDASRFGTDTPINWQYLTNGNSLQITPQVTTFPLENIDTLRQEILSFAQTSSAYELNSLGLAPYSYILSETTEGIPYALYSQEGLALKTYQSDLYNNWLKTEYTTYINTVSSVSTAGGSFSIESLNIASKVYNLLTRVAVSGGTLNDWIETVYDEEAMRLPETPMWVGGASWPLGFQKVTSQSLSDTQPLGTIGGTGQLDHNRKHGGNIIIKVKEPCYIMGIFSLTPLIDYSQGNDWDLHLQTFADLHVPELDQIGWEDSINEERAWWSTKWDGTKWVQTAAGKVPAWIKYTTAVNKTYGDFAMVNNQMFMTLNRRYEFDDGDIADLTTYIDPSKFNFVFAQASLTAQNFRVQIGIDNQARRKMSARQIPNL